MAVTWYIPRPDAVAAAKWDGTNFAEIEEVLALMPDSTLEQEGDDLYFDAPYVGRQQVALQSWVVVWPESNINAKTEEQFTGGYIATTLVPPFAYALEEQ